MEFILVASLFLLGAVCASFVGLVVARLYTGASILSGRSKCDSCGRTLSPAALIPILSWVWLQGRCRDCGCRISVASTVAEATLGTLFVFSYFKLGLSLSLFVFLAALTFLLGIVLYDLYHKIIPPIFLLPFILCSLAFAILSVGFGALISTSFVALGVGGSLLLLHLLSAGRAMGLADAPLAFGLSLLAAPAAFSGFIFSFWIGAVIGIILLAGRPSGRRIGIEVPFAPFLACGFLLAYFTQWDPFVFFQTLIG